MGTEKYIFLLGVNTDLQEIHWLKIWKASRLSRAVALVLNFDALRHEFSHPNMRHKAQGVTPIRKFICPPTPTLGTGMHLVLTM